MMGSDGKKRCFGNVPGQAYYTDYHDQEWGRPVHDERRLFEMLILEGAQAGLSWDLILKKRAGYRKAFHQFEPERVARMSDDELTALRSDPRIVRNRLKISAARQNARVFLGIQADYGSFDRYLWSFIGPTPRINQWQSQEEIPTCTVESEALSKDLKKKGMLFVGPTIIYAYMQAVGMVDDHLRDCWLRSGLP